MGGRQIIAYPYSWNGLPTEPFEDYDIFSCSQMVGLVLLNLGASVIATGTHESINNGQWHVPLFQRMSTRFPQICFMPIRFKSCRRNFHNNSKR